MGSALRKRSPHSFDRLEVEALQAKGIRKACECDSVPPLIGSQPVTFRLASAVSRAITFLLCDWEEREGARPGGFPRAAQARRTPERRLRLRYSSGVVRQMVATISG